MSSTLLLWTGLLAVLVLATCYVLKDLIALLWRQHFSPLQRLRGPPSPSFLFGNLREMYNQENTGLLYDWDATYGSTYAYKGFFGGSRLLTTDLTAVAHILSHPDTYQKPDFVRDNLAAMGAGNESVLTTEGDVHRRQVRFPFPLANLFFNCSVIAQNIGGWRRSLSLHSSESLYPVEPCVHSIEHQTTDSSV